MLDFSGSVDSTQNCRQNETGRQSPGGLFKSETIRGD
jgi:hypothetical protein